MGELVFAVGPSARDSAARALGTRLARLLGEALGEDVRVEPAGTYPQLVSALERGVAHLAWAPPAVYVHTHESAGVRPLVTCMRHREGGYRGALFARADRHAELPEEGAAPTVAWVDPHSCGGFLFPRFALVERGFLPKRYFREQQVLGSHAAVVRAVASGRVDLGATYVHVAQGADQRIEHAGWHATDGMHPLLISRPIPSDLICATAPTWRQLGGQLSDALRGVAEAPDAADLLDGLFQARGFGPVDESAYEVVRAALNVAELPSLKGGGSGNR